jgi:hypothetical protein
MLGNLKLNVFEEPAAYKFKPESGKDETLVEYGKRFAQELAAQKPTDKE